MLRILRAFAWMRWRVLINSLERRGSRDVLERVSIAVEQVTPVLLLLVLIPSCVALCGLGAYDGWTVARGESAPRMMAGMRYLLFAALLFCVLGPLVMPAAERTSAVRLLLLPIRRRLLYAAQCMSTFADPWILLSLAIVLGVPLGMLAAGALTAAVMAGIAGGLLIAALSGLTLLVSVLMHLLVRDRKRGEFLAVLLIVGLPLIGMLPALFQGQRQRGDGGRGAGIERRQREPPAWQVAFERRVLVAAPSELYTNVARRAAANPAATVVPLAGLAAGAALLHGLALLLFTRVLSSPGSTGSSRRSDGGERRQWRIPGVSPGISAVALNQLRIALRTPRGRSALISPIAVFVMFAVMMWRNGNGMDFGPIRLRSGLGLAVFGSYMSLLSVLPLAMNQFAIDRAGLTLTLLAPLDTTALLRGKAIGNALIAGVPAILIVAGAAVLFPGGNPALWLCIPLALLATYSLLAPAAAALSAIFPRAVDLNSIGRGSNAHGAAGLLGTLATIGAGVPCALLVLLATRGVGRALLAPVFLIVWLGLCLAAALLLFRMAAAVFDRRRENLAMLERSAA
jgi:hypothetical protein